MEHTQLGKLILSPLQVVHILESSQVLQIGGQSWHISEKLSSANPGGQSHYSLINLSPRQVVQLA